MIFKKIIKDSFITGIITGMLTLIVAYGIASGIRFLIAEYRADPYVLRPPAVQLVALLISLLVFRVIFINYKKEKTGKGFLMIIVLSTLAFFFIYNKMK